MPTSDVDGWKLRIPATASERLDVTNSVPVHWVVIGAGSAGCVVVRRLVDAGHRVTLIEAGPALSPGHVPTGIAGANSFAALTDDRIHPDLLATRTAGSESRVYLRGRGVGGSSAVNAMVALEGDPDLYASWGWDTAKLAAGRHLIPSEPALDRELGRVDRALLAASPNATKSPLTRQHGQRVTSAEAYLWPILSNDRLDVRTDSLVDRVVSDNRSVTGVLLASGDIVRADRVVVSAGAIHSPSILLRSSLGVDGIGDGLQDHPAAALLLELKPDEHTEPSATKQGSGEPRAGLSTATLIDSDPIQILAMNHLGATPGPGMLLVANMRPVSMSGTVRLRSDDPTDHPIVDFDLLSDPADVATLRSGVHMALELLEHQAFDAIVDRVLIDDVGTTADTLDSDEAVDAWLLRHGADYVHASGTCAIGRVTESDGAVVGHEGLYVCDASLFPTVPNVNTHLPTTMLAEELVTGWLAPSA